MSQPLVRPLALALALALVSPAALAARFVYEGRLDDAGQPANGRYDLKLTAYGHAAQGATLAAPVTFEGVEVRDGRFRLDVDLPLVKADQVWLEVAVRAAGEPAFAEIPGRAKAIAAPLIGACWSTVGDSGSNPATNFIGTTDAQAFVVRTQNVQSLRIEPSTVLFGGNPITANVIAGSSANFVTPGVRGATIAGGGVPSGDSDPNFASEAPNRITDAYGTIGGGYNNLAGDGSGTLLDRGFATVSGGGANTASGLVSTVSGGVLNTASGQASVVGGGDSNQATALATVVAGGLGNQASANYAAIAGGTLNNVSAENSAIGGGVGNAASGPAGTIGGGDRNTTSAFGAVVSGGQLNSATGVFTTISGGDGNLAQGMRSSIGGGFSNRSAGTGSTIAGGALNQTLGQDSAIAGGLQNVAVGNFSMVSAGLQSCAGAAFSWAGGRRAKVRPSAYFGDSDACSGLTYPGGDGDIGSFVWADSTDSDFVSSGANQFLIRAGGGFGFNTNTIPGGIEAVFRSRGVGDQNTDIYLRTASHGRGINLAMLPTPGAAEFRIAQFDGITFVDRILLASNGDFSVTAQAFKPGGGSWAVPSDARLKTAIAPLDGALDRLLALRGVRFEYRPEVTPKAMYLAGPQIGFIAQEVETVFPEWIAETEEGFRTVGPRGFEALTVEALRELRAESTAIDGGQNSRIAALEAENAALRAELARRDAEHRARLDRLEALLGARVAGGR
jgi:hypothetical protein